MEHNRGQRLVWVFFIILLLVLGLGVLTYDSGLRTTRLTRELVEVDLRRLDQIHALKTAVVRQEPILYEYYTTADQATFLRNFAANEQQIRVGLAALGTIYPGRPETMEIQARYARTRTLATTLNEIMSDPDGVNRNLARELLAANTMESSAVIAKVDQLLKRLRGGVFARGEQSRETVRESVTFTLVSGMALLLVGFAAYTLRAYLSEVRERRRLALFPECNPHPHLSLTPAAQVTYANPAAHRFAQDLGLSQLEWLLPKDIGQRIAQALARGDDRLSEFEYELNGAVLLCELVPVRDQQQLHIYLTNVTAARSAERALVAAKEEAEAASRSKSQFLANMSHEIRTPMNGVVGMVELLRDTRLDEHQRSLVETMQRSSTSLLGVFNDILDFSKIEAGKLVLEYVAVDPRELVEDVLDLVGPRAQEKGIALRADIAVEVPERVRADPLRLRQVLTNLTGNAIKSTDQGEVTVRVLAQQQHGMATLRFEVQDTGIGIPASAQGHVFDSFTQAGGSTARRYGGTGLGLAIVRELVHLMHGQVGLISSEGKGTLFWFEVPATQAEAVPATASVRAPAHARFTGEVLLVEDNAVNQIVSQR